MGVVVPSTLSHKYLQALRAWLGASNVRAVDTWHLLNRMTTTQKLWAKTFQKLWLHNLTDYDKVIVLDADVLVRTDISHWFEYPAPCGAQQKDSIAWNSGAMVIAPSTEVFERMMDQLPGLVRYEGSKVFSEDPLIGGYGDQDFQTAFFLTDKETAKRRCIMPSEASILSSSIGEEWWDYYDKYRPWLYQTVHFTTLKPWVA